MNQQSLTAKVRDNFRKMIRKKELEKRFQEHRKNWQIGQKKLEEEEFYRVYPTINDENYQENIPFLLHYSCNDSYNFMLVPLMGYTYEHMMGNPGTEENYLILEVMTQFEEIELPQTEEFAALMVESLPRRCKVVLNIIANLLEHSRYSQILRDLLLEHNFLREVEIVLENQLENGAESESMRNNAYLYFFICCEFIKSHPVVDRQTFEGIVRTMAGMISGEEEKYLLFQALYHISCTNNPSHQTAYLLFSLFYKVAIDEYFKYDEEITHFLTYCIRSDVPVGHEFQKLLIGSLEHHNEEVRKKALHFFQIQLEKTMEFEKKELYESLKEGDFVTRISNLFIASNLDVQGECMQCLGMLARQIAIDDSDPDQSSNFIRLILTALDNKEMSFLTKTLRVLLTVVQTLSIEQPQQSSIYSSMENFNLLSKLQELNDSNREIGKLVSQIEDCISSLPMMN